jgi:hypothetical protein
MSLFDASKIRDKTTMNDDTLYHNMREGKEKEVAFLTSHGADHSTISHGGRLESEEKDTECSDEAAQLQQLGSSNVTEINSSSIIECDKKFNFVSCRR